MRLQLTLASEISETISPFVRPYLVIISYSAILTALQTFSQLQRRRVVGVLLLSVAAYSFSTSPSIAFIIVFTCRLTGVFRL